MDCGIVIKMKLYKFLHHFQSVMSKVSDKIYDLMQESHWSMKTSIIPHGHLQTPWEHRVTPARTSRERRLPFPSGTCRRSVLRNRQDETSWTPPSDPPHEQSHPKSREFSQHRGSTHGISNMDPALQWMLIFMMKCILMLSHCKTLFSPQILNDQTPTISWYLLFA